MNECCLDAAALCSHFSLGQNDKRMLENMTASNLFKTKLIPFSLFVRILVLDCSRYFQSTIAALIPVTLLYKNHSRLNYKWKMIKSTEEKNNTTKNGSGVLNVNKVEGITLAHLYCIAYTIISFFTAQPQRPFGLNWIGFRFGYKSTFSWIVWLLNWQRYFLHFHFLKSSFCSESSERSVLF